MAYRAVVDRFAEDAAGLWVRRQRAALAPHYRLRDLAAVDSRLEAQLDGLRLAGKDAERAVGELDPSEDGVGYLRATLALERKNALELAKLLDQLPARPELAGEVAGALGWVTLERSSWALGALCDAGCPAPLRRFGLSAWIAHRENPGKLLEDALRAGHAGLRATALEGTGLLGLTDRLPEIRGELDSPNEAIRRAATESAALLGDEVDTEILWRHADPDTLPGRASLGLALALTPASAARARLEGWLAEPERRRAALVGAGLLGTPASLPQLIDAMGEPALARSAGEAFERITGIRIAGPLAGDAPEGFAAGPNDDPNDAHVAPDPEGPLAWPRREAVERAFAEWRRQAPSAERLLLGRPLDAQSCAEALRGGSQRLRADVAVSRALLAPGEPLLDTTAPGFRQLGRG